MEIHPVFDPSTHGAHTYIETKWGKTVAASGNYCKTSVSPGAFAKLFQRTHQSSPWKSNNSLMSQFPTLCISHFQCLFPQNQLAFCLWITPICISQKPDCMVLIFYSSVLFQWFTSSPSLNAYSSHWEDDFFTSNLLKMSWRDTYISRQAGHPSSKWHSGSEALWIVLGSPEVGLTYWPRAGTPCFGDQYFRLTWALDLIPPSLWYWCVSA